MLPKSPSGIAGLDAITQGGLPRGRSTLLCGGAGSGKTMIALSFLVHGAAIGEPGVLVSFEERASELAANFRSLGHDLDTLSAAGQLRVDHIQIERGDIEESGGYDLEGLFIRLGHAVDSIGAKRVVLDTIESLFSVFTQPAILRAELRRLFGWLKDRGLTAIITAERGEGTLTRQGLEEYVSDCVILLDNRVIDNIATRRLRVVKYRGSPHGGNEYPFLIDEKGISVLPADARRDTAMPGPAALPSPAALRSPAILPSGVEGFDAMLGRGGFHAGASILLSGHPGTGKSTFASHFAAAACATGRRVMIFLFEESAAEAIRNAASVGLHLAPLVEAGLLRIEAARPSLYGLEMHLARMHRDITAFDPAVVVVDPISAFRGSPHEVYATLLRMVDMLKADDITAMFTALVNNEDASLEPSDYGLSSLMDAWVRLQDAEVAGIRRRRLSIVKVRGMAHSNRVREYGMTGQGIAFVAPPGDGPADPGLAHPAAASPAHPGAPEATP